MAAFDQAVVASSQFGAGIGNLAFSLIAARLLVPGSFAELASFLAFYNVLSLPGSSISAVASLDPNDARRILPRLLAVAGAIGVALGLGSVWLSQALHLSVAMVIVLGLSTPGVCVLALERGRLYGRRGHGRLGVSLVVEPVVRLTLGVILAEAIGANGGAIAIMVAGYVALEVARHTKAVAPASGGVVSGADDRRRIAKWTAVAFFLLVIVQNQDLLIANAVLSPANAGRFAVISTLGGVAAFATMTAPLVLLPRLAAGERHAALSALLLVLVIGGLAVAVSAVTPRTIILHLFGARYGGISNVVAPYMLAMALLGVARVLAAFCCAVASGRLTSSIIAGAVAAQEALIVSFGHNPREVALCTLTATVGICVILTPVAVRGYLRIQHRSGANPVV